MIKDFPELEFIGGGEESFGFMVGEFVRDKDAVTASLLACEIAAQAKADGSSFYNELLKCYEAFGLFKERLVSITKKGISGAAEIKQIMIDLRENPVKELAGEKVVRIEDYASSIAYDLENSKEEKMEIPASNVLIYYTENGTKMAARPSGTEPKIKFYFSANTGIGSIDDFASTEKVLDEKLDAILKQLELN